MLPAVIHSLNAAEIEQRWDARKLRGLFEVTDDDYHKGPGISSTGIKRILKSPAHFNCPIEDNDNLRRGRLVHEAMLQPAVFWKKYIAETRMGGPKNKNPWKAQWDAFKEQALAYNKEILSLADADLIAGISESLNKSSIYSGVITDARKEIAAFTQWNCGEVPLLCKAKADILLPDVIADLKTCEDASAEKFQWSIVNYGYHISAAYYLDVFSDCLEKQMDAFVWVCVEKSPPHGIKFYTATKEMLDIGRQEYKRALEIYAKCLTTGNWPGYDEAFEAIDLPASYARRFTK